MAKVAKSPSQTRRIFSLLTVFLLVGSFLPIALILTTQGGVVSSPILVAEENSPEDPPTNVFGNPALPDWKDVLVDNSDPKWLVVNNSDGLVFRFATEKDKFNEIYQDNVLIVKDERWLIWFDGKEGGSTRDVEWERVENYNVRVTQFYEDVKAGSGSSYKVIWDFYGGFRPKITVELDAKTAGHYKIDWRANLYKDYAENKINYVKFWDENENAVVFDYSDVYEALGDITTVENIEGWFKGKRFDLYFDVGNLGVGGFRLDPNFGKEEVGATQGAYFKNEIRGSWYTCPETGTADSIKAYVRAYSADYYDNAKCAIYKVSDNSLVGGTEETYIDWHEFQWGTFNFSDPKPSLSNEDYWLCFWPSDYSYFINDTASSKGGKQGVTYNSWPNPWDPTLIDIEWSIFCTYSTEAAAPGKPVLVSPENNHSTSDNTPTFVWENGSDATSHRLVIDDSQGFDDGDNIYDNAGAWDNSGTAIENELPADNYWWRVCATNAQGDNWSENTWTFEVVPGEEYERSIEQGFSLTGLAPSGREFGRVIEQGFSLGAVVTIAMEICKLLSQAFGFTGAVGVAVQRVPREFERGVAQGFSFEDTVIGHEYGDIYVTSPWCDNRANPIDVVDPTFSAIYTVTDNNIPNLAQFIQIQIGTSLNDNDLWDNIATVTVENGQRSPNVSYDGMPLTLNSTYWWRCRFGDSNGNLTEWTSPQTFGYQEAPFDLVAAAMFIFPIVLMVIAFAFDNVVFASFAGIVFILSGLFFVDVIWLAMIFVGIGVFLLIAAFLSEED